jgi:hypothetical protein
MQIDTTNDRSALDDTTGQAVAATAPYETERQAAADVAGIYAQCDRSNRRGVMSEANLAYLRDACERARVSLGAFDDRILAWLANWEPETCAVIVGMVTRAYAAGLSAARTAGPLLDPYCQAGQHANCPGRLCRCPHCQHERRQA